MNYCEDYRSLVLKTALGEFIHFSEIAEIFATVPSREDATEYILKHGEQYYGTSLWIVSNSNKLHLMDTSDDFNQRSMGVSTYQSGSVTTNELVQRRILEVWADMKYPKYANFFGK